MGPVPLFPPRGPKRKFQIGALTFVAEDTLWAEVDAFGPDPGDDWDRPPDCDEPREPTFVDEDTFSAEF